jgi:hypothetical protein
MQRVTLGADKKEVCTAKCESVLPNSSLATIKLRLGKGLTVLADDRQIVHVKNLSFMFP